MAINKMKVEKIDKKTYTVDGVGVWISGGTPRCCECYGPLVAMSASCRHARAVKRLIQKGKQGRQGTNDKRGK